MATETAAPADETPGYVQPEVDVVALQRLLDGRDLVGAAR